MIFLMEKDYEVGMATTENELDEIYALRYTIFNNELGEGISESEKTKRDKDKFDAYCDHIIVRYRPANQIIGTYRIMLGSKAEEGYYSETEFDCSDIHKVNEEVAEIGRTCILKEHRGGNVLQLLWFGLTAYTQMHNVRYLFGMTSVHTKNEQDINQMWSYLRTKRVFSRKVQVIPKNPPSLKRERPNKQHVPRLLTKYLKVGAKIIGEPNYDEIFGCYDIPTWIDLKSYNIAMRLVVLQSKVKIAMHRYSQSGKKPLQGIREWDKRQKLA